MLSYNEIKVRKYIVLDGTPYEVIASLVSSKQANKPTNQTKLKSLIDGKVVQKNFHSSEKVTEADIETKKIKYLYSNRGEVWFNEENNPKNRFSIAEDIIGDKLKFIKENAIVDAVVFNEKIIGIKLPIKVELRVKEAPPAVRGNTAQGANKQVTLETNLVINTPIFIKEGDLLRINTETGEYVERV
ncbi:elongation factor P [Patescibacteria group bacterium]